MARKAAVSIVEENAGSDGMPVLAPVAHRVREALSILAIAAVTLGLMQTLETRLFRSEKRT